MKLVPMKSSSTDQVSRNKYLFGIYTPENIHPHIALRNRSGSVQTGFTKDRSGLLVIAVQYPNRRTVILSF